jgi:ABC-type nitrate/sulfonate/bicarbonate transport system substrate-binding protein
MTALTHIKAGFLPLLDSVLLVLAREKGFAEAQGLELQLVRETSWANIRDRAAVGHFISPRCWRPCRWRLRWGLIRWPPT